MQPQLKAQEASCRLKVQFMERLKILSRSGANQEYMHQPKLLAWQSWVTVRLSLPLVNRYYAQFKESDIPHRVQLPRI